MLYLAVGELSQSELDIDKSVVWKSLIEYLKQILDILDTTGFIFSMAMFGKTLFSIIKINEIIEIEKVIQKLVKNNKQIIITQFDTQGARLIS